jgi:hypothetical protein
MVAAINAGLAQKLFGLRPDDEDPKPHVFEFSVDGISSLGYVHPIGWGELSIHAALWPTPTLDCLWKYNPPPLWQACRRGCRVWLARTADGPLFDGVAVVVLLPGGTQTDRGRRCPSSLWVANG